VDSGVVTCRSEPGPQDVIAISKIRTHIICLVISSSYRDKRKKVLPVAL
jgi:hypothetical protein